MPFAQQYEKVGSSLGGSGEEVGSNLGAAWEDAIHPERARYLRGLMKVSSTDNEGIFN
ncbi:MAG: hypothetical protein PUJ04_01255 [Bacteroidales bacterium]|nr:hypothetical protein [Bacteroidales bacterium]